MRRSRSRDETLGDNKTEGNEARALTPPERLFNSSNGFIMETSDGFFAFSTPMKAVTVRQLGCCIVFPKPRDRDPLKLKTRTACCDIGNSFLNPDHFFCSKRSIYQIVVRGESIDTQLTHSS